MDEDERSKERVPFTEEAVRDYLDTCIRFWRDARDKRFLPGTENHQVAVISIDVFQSVRTSLFGETLPEEPK